MAASKYYHLQCSFNAGELSPEVSNQVTLEKYQYALLQAQNALIRPYGPVYRRPGSIFISQTKFNNKKSIVVPFNGADNQDYVLEIGEYYVRVFLNGVYQNIELTTPFAENDLELLKFTQSADTMFIASGKYPVKVLGRTASGTWVFRDYQIDEPYYAEELLDASEDFELTPSGTTGNITLTTNEDYFTANMVGLELQIKQTVASKSVGINANVIVGDSWKIITSGTWNGTLKIERSFDGGVTWKEYRSYTSASNFNASESGTVTEEVLMRMTYAGSGTCTATLTSLPYDHIGKAKITAVTDARTASALVTKDLADTSATTLVAPAAWSNWSGYPRTVTFFQDRLCFGGTQRQPYMMWMSRTGDYPNFSVEKASGTLTDDSAIAVSFVSRRQYEIKHLMASTDLVIMTTGNEWIINGSEVVTPTKITPKMQTTRGCSDIEPIPVGNKIIFVQDRGSVVRDMGYSYESDSYTGNDLTLLAAHLIENNKIVDAAYKQQPDSTLYFVRNDGTIICLTYVIEQNVYAWSTIDTKGQIEAICCAREGEKDYLYVVVKRSINDADVRYLEKFANNNSNSNNPDDYISLDCSYSGEFATATNTFNVPHLANENVDVLGDGRVYENQSVDASGNVTIKGNVHKVQIGLPFSMNIEVPNIENRTGDGTMQGRQKHISECILRLFNTLGGRVGRDFNIQDQIKYDELSGVDSIHLFSGDKRQTLPIGGFDIEGRVTITSKMPYPFNLLMMVREVTFGG